MPPPTVTVLTAVHDGERYLAATIDSVLAQTFADWEMVIVDDASSDATPDVIRGYAERDPRIRTLRRDTAGGPYVAANAGLDLAQGRLVARLDADDLFVPGRLASQVAFLDRHPDLRACVGSWRWIDEHGTVNGDVRRVHTTSPRVLRWSLCVVAGMVHSTAMIERDALETVGRYEPARTSADLALWFALSQRGWLGVMPDVLVQYRRHATQITSKQPSTQRELAHAMLQRHLQTMTGEGWAMEHVRALYASGRWEEASFDDGLAALDRWQTAWRRDDGLQPADRRELRALTARIRLRHIRMNGHGLANAIRGLASFV